MATIISRSTWKARYRNGVGARKIGNLGVILHHTVTAQLSANATLAQDIAAVRTVELIGQQRFGAGMSYNLLVMPSGRIFQGTGIGRISYHSGPGRNTTAASISLVGNYEQHQLGTKAFNSVVALLRHGVRQGWWRTPRITEAHRNFSSTACPGKNAFSRIGAINSAAGSSSTPKPPTKPPSGGGSSKLANPEITKRLDRMGYPRMTYLKDRIRRFQSSQIYAPGLKADGIWGPFTEAHYQWVRRFQSALNEWKAVTPKLQVDGDYRANTARGCKQHQDRNAGARSTDRNRSRRIPNSRQRKMLGNLKIHPGG